MNSNSFSNSTLLGSFAIWIVSVIFMLATKLPVILGSNIPQDNLLIDYANSVAIQFFFLSLIFMVPYHSYWEKRWLGVVWILKCIIVSFVMPFYENHYHFLDSYGYFSPGVELHPIFVRGEGTKNIQVFSSYLRSVGFDSFRVQTSIYSFLGYIGIVIFYKSFKKINERVSRVSLLLFCIFPSTLFWSSTLGKDSIMLLLISIVFFGVTESLSSANKITTATSILYVGLTIFFISYVRLWMSFILSISIGLIFIAKYFRRMNAIQMPLYFGAILSIVSYYFDSIYERIALYLRILIQLTKAWSRGGSSQQVTQNLSDPLEFLDFYAEAMFSALFQPIGFKSAKLFQVIAGIESLLVFFCVLVGFPKLVQYIQRSKRGYKFVLSYLFVWSSIYGFVSYQNLGTAVRFRLQVQPILLFIAALGIIGINDIIKVRYDNYSKI